MRRIFTFFLTFLLGVFVTALYAQTHTVSGTVIDKDANEPLIGANVLILKSASNLNGNLNCSKELEHYAS